MNRRIEAFYGPSSPWAYFGAQRLYKIADRHDCELVLRPIRVVQENGGIMLRTRPQARQDYHAIELDRWRHHLDMPLNLRPKFYPCRSILPAAYTMIAAQRANLDARRLSFAIQRALWAEDRDIADINTLRSIAIEQNIPNLTDLIAEDWPQSIISEWEGNLTEAVNIGIFGTPTYVLDGQLYWGQDRLEFLESALSDK
jgi:2-hydroxychromene-2-carboxylate isomerase